jgi:hypothetical protein
MKRIGENEENELENQGQNMNFLVNSYSNSYTNLEVISDDIYMKMTRDQTPIWAVLSLFMIGSIAFPLYFYMIFKKKVENQMPNKKKY